MKLRKFIFICCVFLSLALFTCGIAVLGFTNVKFREKFTGKNNYSQQLEELNKEYTKDKKKPINMIVFGLDDEQVRSDVIVLMNFSPNNGSLNILSIARDTLIRTKGKNAKINAMIGMGGEKLAIQKITELTGINIDYYLTINFKGFRKIIDELDGVVVDVPVNMDYDDPDQNLHIHLRKGRQLLNGEKAEQFVRYRKGNFPGEGYTDGDIGRIKMQQKFIKDLIIQKFRLKYFSKADDIYYILKKYVKTNIEIGDVNYYLNNIMNINYNEINTFTLPGESDFIDDIWYFICDKKKTKGLVQNNFSR